MGDCDLDCNCDCFESDDCNCDCDNCCDCDCCDDCGVECCLLKCRDLMQCLCCCFLCESSDDSYWYVFCPCCDECCETTTDNSDRRRRRQKRHKDYEEERPVLPTPINTQPPSALNPPAGSGEPTGHVGQPVEVVTTHQPTPTAFNELGSDVAGVKNGDCAGDASQEPPPPSYEEAVKR